MNDSKNTSHWIVAAAVIFVLIILGVSMWRAPAPVRPATRACVIFKQISVIKEVQDCKEKGGKFSVFQHRSFADHKEYLDIQCVLPEKKITDEQVPL